MKSKRKKILTKRLYIIYNDKINIYNTIIIYINIIILYDTSYNKSGYYINMHFQAYFSQKIHYVSRETLVV